ncbi:MAG: DUF4197 domain-containing protein [Chitinophagales bacterium]|nr:DUF4197 domain-containing protein [Chitinophagales bacterium]
MIQLRIVLMVVAILFINSADAQSRKKSKKTTRSKSTTINTGSPATNDGTATVNSGSSSPIDNVVGAIGGLIGASGSGSMSNDLAANGLKEALNVGTELAANNLGRVDGFLANAAVKILFPPEARKVESTLRSLGMNSVCDQVITSVNRAAEAAVVEAKPIFVEAIKQMTITDAINILTGEKDAATQYLMRTSGQALMAKFEPIIQSNLQKTNATKYWSDAVNAYNAVPFVQKLNPNLSQYVTQKASDGIFLMVAQEEAKIRENPTQRIGTLLQDVFGWADKNRN